MEKVWTAEDIKAAIDERIAEGKGVSATDLQEEDMRLYLEITKMYRSWGRGLTALGYDIKKHKRNRKKWTEEKIREELEKRLSAGKGISATDLQEDDLQLSRGILRKYGSWGRGLEALGYDPNEHRREGTVWTDEMVKERLEERLSEGKGISVTDLLKEDEPLYRVLVYRYGNWTNAMKELGYDPSKYSRKTVN